MNILWHRNQAISSVLKTGRSLDNSSGFRSSSVLKVTITHWKLWTEEPVLFRSGSWNDLDKGKNQFSSMKSRTIAKMKTCWMEMYKRKQSPFSVVLVLTTAVTLVTQLSLNFPVLISHKGYCVDIWIRREDQAF